MEDAFVLIVLTLLQLCRAETNSLPEWYAANLVNDASYTPKPLTEIFSTDSTFTSKNPTVFITPTTEAAAVSTSTNLESLSGSQKQAEIPELPSIGFVQVIYDPNQQTNPNPQQLTTSPPEPETSTIFVETRPTNGPIQNSFIPQNHQTTQPPQQYTQGTTVGPFQIRNLQQTASTSAPSNLQPTFGQGRWDGAGVYFPISGLPSNMTPCANTTSAPVTETVATTPQSPRPASSKPILTVRVKTPKGSITNILINPTTTTKPTTTRRRKTTKKTNNYEVCMDSCKGKKEPICGSPMGVFPINPDRLKGFPSLCHMACHNSFKRDQVYDKVADGRCGRLRTRIRPVDKNKLNREELNKAQYTILHNGPETVMEFSQLSH